VIAVPTWMIRDAVFRISSAVVMMSIPKSC
jgi:hypothetical protein